MALTGLAIAAGLGLAKSELIDKPQAKRDRKLAAETQRLSPWTGLKADPVKEADPFGTALQFGATGAMMGSNYENAKLNEAMANRLNSGGNLWGWGPKMDSFNKADALPITGGTTTMNNMTPVEKSWWSTLNEDPYGNGMGWAGRNY